MDPRPVGVFDSGMGGLTVLHECLVTMPHEDFVYLGDGARCPYGPRHPEEIRRFAVEIAASKGLIALPERVCVGHLDPPELRCDPLLPT
jgi:glutamate racemase